VKLYAVCINYWDKVKGPVILQDKKGRPALFHQKKDALVLKQEINSAPRMRGYARVEAWEVLGQPAISPIGQQKSIRPIRAAWMREGA